MLKKKKRNQSIAKLNLTPLLMLKKYIFLVFSHLFKYLTQIHLLNIIHLFLQ